jgi:chemotaxis protein CheZ
MTGNKGSEVSVSGENDPLRAELERRLKAMANEGPRTDPSDIASAVESVMATVEGDLSAVNLKLYAEIESLARYIDGAKAEIAEIRPDEIRDEHLPAATDELEQIVGATENATNQILESVESVEEVAEQLDADKAEKITDAVTNIYEACSFQDITGQRITKVVKTLQQIETKVEALLAAFGEEVARERRRKSDDGEAQQGGDEDQERALMNGPAASGEGVSQDDIDALLAGFD